MLEEFKNIWRKGGNPIHQLIAVNVIVFLIMHIVLGILTQSGLNPDVFFDFLALPSHFGKLLTRPWTILTHGFVHTPNDLFHVGFNMLFLFWFGKIFSQFHAQQKVIPVFLLGVFAGAGLFLIGGATGLLASPDAFLVGASAGVYAIITSTALLAPNMNLRLFLIGEVKLKYVVLFMILYGTIIENWANTGGKLAHLGGIGMAFLYLHQYRKGKDISQWLIKLINLVKRFKFQRKSKLRVVGNQPKKTRNDDVYRAYKAANQKRIDQILDKINKSGWSSLSKQEKDDLANSNRD